MRGVKIARRYAKSLIDLANEQNLLQETKNDMDLFLNTCQSSKEFSLLLKSPVVKSDKKEKIIDSIFASKINKTSLLFIKLLIQKRREIMAEAIASQFIQLYKTTRGIKTATVTTATQLNKEQQFALKEKIQHLIGSNVELEEKIDASLIGGFVIRVDDNEINSSIISSLNKLKQEFDTNPYIKEY